MALFSHRSNDGLQSLHMRQCCRVAAMVTTLGGQEIQVNDTTHEPLPVCPFLPGKNNLQTISITSLEIKNELIIICMLQLPCDEHWKREELRTYLMQAPIWQWEGSPIQHMGQPGYISMVYIINKQKQVVNALMTCILYCSISYSWCHLRCHLELLKIGHMFQRKWSFTISNYSTHEPCSQSMVVEPEHQNQTYFRSETSFY